MERTPQEQLRIDHIKTLEVLEKTAKENEKLREKLKRLNSQDTANLKEDKEEEPEDSSISVSGLSSELKKKENEIKMLKLTLRDKEKVSFSQTKSTISQEQYSADIGKLRNENSMLSTQLTDCELELREKDRKAREEADRLKEANACYLDIKKQLDDLVESMPGSTKASYELDDNCLQCESMILACSELSDELNKLKFENASGDMDRQNVQNLLRLKENELQIELQLQARKESDMYKQMDEKQQKIQSLKQELFVAKNELKEYKLQMIEVQKELVALETEKENASEASDPVNGRIETRAVTASVGRCSTCYQSISRLNSADKNKNQPPVTFDQFVTLKRENRELKLALTEYMDTQNNPQKNNSRSSAVKFSNTLGSSAFSKGVSESPNTERDQKRRNARSRRSWSEATILNKEGDAIHLAANRAGLTVEEGNSTLRSSTLRNLPAAKGAIAYKR